MKKVLVIALLIGGHNIAWADNSLQFATTAADFVQALQQQPTTNQRQRRSYRSRGVETIVQDEPSVGALIQFDFDSAEIKLDSYSLLREFAYALEGGLSDANIKIVGHTDSLGADNYNLWLSIRRAQAVKNFMVSAYGINASRLTITGFGEYHPIASNETASGQALNRRVEFVRINN